MDNKPNHPLSPDDPAVKDSAVTDSANVHRLCVQLGPAKCTSGATPRSQVGSDPIRDENGCPGVQCGPLAGEAP